MGGTQDLDSIEARKCFPRGLEQADDVHFSLDALLLAAFAPPSMFCVDLGGGCGVVGLGLLLRRAAQRVLALDVDETQVTAAVNNARKLGVAEHFTAEYLDFTQEEAQKRLKAVQADLAVTNPPWRRAGAERTPASASRSRALYGTEATCALFACSAARSLKRGGRFAALVGADRLADMVRAMEDVRIAPSRLLLVHPYVEKKAVFALVEGRFAAKSRLEVLSPLFVHEAPGGAYSAAALDFCPWLEGHCQ